MLEAIAKGIGALAGVLLVGIGMIAVFTYPVMWLWNGLLPELFGAPELTFWQTFGLMVLTRVAIPSVSIKKSK